MKKYNWQILLINVVSVLALAVVLLPLLMIAQYNYPSADDWSFSVYCYKALNNGEGLIGVIKGVIEAVKFYYFNWEGRYSIAIMGALQPGIWGEKCYSIVSWLLIGSIVISEMILFRFMLRSWKSDDNKWIWLPIIVPPLILQFLYCPAPIESFYWYNGAINYTFMYSLSLILLVMLLAMATETYSKWKEILLFVGACIITILVGGNNFATSLSTFLTMIVLSILLSVVYKKVCKRIWFITVLMGSCLMVCIFAPGNSSRINANFGGETGNAVNAIITSLVRSFTNIYSWTNIKVVLMIIFILPFVWKCVKTMQCEFRFPGVFTLLTFGLYASQITATMYVDGTTGGGRMAAILFYSYMIWVVGNIIYWSGWLNKRQNKFRNILEQIFSKLQKLLIPYCAVIGVLLVGIIYMTDLRQLTSYKAYRDWRQGWAQQYATEWDARLEILHDDTITNVEFLPLSVNPEMLMYTDLQDENGYVWVNSACAEYYEKESIVVVIPEN